MNSPPKITHLLLGEENDISDGWTGQTYILYTKRCLEDQSDLEIEVCIGGDQEILVMANSSIMTKEIRESSNKAGDLNFRCGAKSR